MDVRKVCTTLHRARRDVEEYGAQRCIGHEGMWNEYGGDVRWEARGDHEMQHCATKKERNLFLKLPLFLDRGGGGDPRSVGDIVFINRSYAVTCQPQARPAPVRRTGVLAW